MKGRKGKVCGPGLELSAASQRNTTKGTLYRQTELKRHNPSEENKSTTHAGKDRHVSTRSKTKEKRKPKRGSSTTKTKRTKRGGRDWGVVKNFQRGGDFFTTRELWSGVQGERQNFINGNSGLVRRTGGRQALANGKVTPRTLGTT